MSFDPTRYVAQRLKRSGRRWFGYDLKFSRLTEFGAEIERYVDQIGDLGVKHVISGKNGGRRGQFHSRVAVDGDLGPLHLDTEDLVVDLYRGSLIEHFERWDNLYLRLDDMHLPTISR